LKNIVTVCSLFLLFSCGEKNAEPIEKYRGKGIVVVTEWKPSGLFYPEDVRVRVKSKDSVFYIYLTDFDGIKLKIGDTIK
jgi:hypothetical protein